MTGTGFAAAHRQILSGLARTGRPPAPADFRPTSGRPPRPPGWTRPRRAGRRPVTVHVNGHQASWEPATAVVLAGATAGCCAPSVERTCGHTNVFATPAAARAHAAGTPS